MLDPVTERTVQIVRGQHKTLLLTAFNPTLGDKDNIAARIPIAGGVVHLRAATTLDSTAPVIAKSSAFPVEAVILGDVAPNTGLAHVFIVPADTLGPTPLAVGKLRFDAWVILPSGKQVPLIVQGFLPLLQEITDLSVPAPPPNVGDPAPQSSAERSFTHTWLANGTSDLVTIPGGVTAMFDDEYVALATIKDIPGGGSFAGIWCPTTVPRTQNQFTIMADASLDMGTTIDIIVRDKA